ncbi:MAG: hypothetical protein HY897_05825 [Deltaproteobacteria bacterium]|nr:hypothetical protein [Deltaproteobacteria bacterium]
MPKSFFETVCAAPATMVIYRDRVEFKNPNVPHGRGPIDPAHFTPYPKNPTLCKFMIQIGRYEELGSGVHNVTKYLPFYAPNAGAASFNEDDMFTVVVPLTPIADDATPQVEAPVEALVKAPVGALSVDQLETASVPSLSQVCPKSVPSEVAERVLPAAETSVDLQTLMEKAGHSNRTRFRNAILKPLIDAGLLGLTVPDKPRSSKQKYRLTEKGREALHPRTGVK